MGGFRGEDGDGAEKLVRFEPGKGAREVRRGEGPGLSEASLVGCVSVSELDEEELWRPWTLGWLCLRERPSFGSRKPGCGIGCAGGILGEFI